MYRSLCTLILTLLLSTTLSWADSCEHRDDKYILIHGIGGSESGFGSMRESLQQQLSCASIFYFSYDTKNSSLRVNDFSKKLDEFILKLPKSVSKKKDINLIMHSQGGLVGLNWIINSYLAKEGFTKGLSSRVNKYISNSTPFWGSDFAMMGENFFFSFGIDKNIISPFGLTQLERMKYGSEFYQQLMRTLTDSGNKNLHRFLKEEIDIVNIAALSFMPGSIFRNFSQFFEGDLIVNIPSMKMNFNYMEYTKKGYKEDEIEKSIMKKVNFSKVSYVTGSHLKMVPGIDGVIDVPEDCYLIEKCDHEAFLTVLNYTSNNKLKNNLEIDESIQGFDIHVQVDLPEGLEEIDDVELNIVKVNDFITVSHYLFKKDTQYSLSDSNKTGYFVFKGTLKSQERGSFIVQITHPQLRARTFEVQVEAGLVTHVKTIVEKK